MLRAQRSVSYSILQCIKRKVIAHYYRSHVVRHMLTLGDRDLVRTLLSLVSTEQMKYFP